MPILIVGHGFKTLDKNMHDCCPVHILTCDPLDKKRK